MTPDQKKKADNLRGAVQMDLAPEDVKGKSEEPERPVPNWLPNCYNCVHVNVCALYKSLFDNMAQFCDFDKPGGSEWLNKIHGLIAGRCNHYEPKK